MANKRSVVIEVFTTYPSAPVLRAMRTTSGSAWTVKNTTLDEQPDSRSRLAASIPLSFGIEMSVTMTSVVVSWQPRTEIRRYQHTRQLRGLVLRDFGLPLEHPDGHRQAVLSFFAFAPSPTHWVPVRILTSLADHLGRRRKNLLLLACTGSMCPK